MATELKPCPFCGGDAKLQHIMGEYWIECRGCEAETTFTVTEDGAAKRWNRRVGRSQAAKEKKNQGRAESLPWLVRKVITRRCRSGMF